MGYRAFCSLDASETSADTARRRDSPATAAARVPVAAPAGVPLGAAVPASPQVLRRRVVHAVVPLLSSRTRSSYHFLPAHSPRFPLSRLIDSSLTLLTCLRERVEAEPQDGQNVREWGTRQRSCVAVRRRGEVTTTASSHDEYRSPRGPPPHSPLSPRGPHSPTHSSSPPSCTAGTKNVSTPPVPCAPPEPEPSPRSAPT